MTGAFYLRVIDDAGGEDEYVGPFETYVALKDHHERYGPPLARTLCTDNQPKNCMAPADHALAVGGRD